MKILSRYTSIPAMLDTLIRQRLVLLDPSTWQDRNDREMMAAYAAAMPHHRVFAYCLAEGRETAHHWQVFADNGRGARINFHHDRLLSALDGYPGVRHEPMSYVEWRTLEPTIPIDRFPFLKRQVFRFEQEYRVIAAIPGVSEDSLSYEIPLPCDCLTSIYISGDIPAPYFETLKGIINAAASCKGIPVRHSGLRRNINWDRAIARRLKPQ